MRSDKPLSVLKSIIRWIGILLIVLLLAVLADTFTSTPRKMAAIKRVLDNKGSLTQVEQLTQKPSQVFYSDHVADPSCINDVKFWMPAPDQEVRWYPKEALPCYFDLWLLVETSTRTVLDWRLFRLDKTPEK